jgi:hypothetical protein
MLPQAVGSLYGFAEPQVVDGKDIWATQAEYQKHLHGPSPDALDRRQRLQHLLVVQPVDACQGDRAAFHMAGKTEQILRLLTR